MWIVDMAFSDRLIIQAVEQLQGQKGVTITQIATHAHISLITTKRAVSRLEKIGKIERYGCGRRWGYEYKVKE
jgi:predicted transcriptional regulator of viral defense system